jgi:hypothetical protein
MDRQRQSVASAPRVVLLAQGAHWNLDASVGIAIASVGQRRVDGTIAAVSAFE